MSTLQIRLHVPSILLGCAAVLAFGLWLPGRSSGVYAQSTRHILGSGAGDWRDLVRVEEGYPFVVPEDRVLVLQSVAYTGDLPFNFASPVQIDVDGKVELLLDPTSGSNSIEPGWVIDPGSRLTVNMEGDKLVGYAFGYLVSL